MTTRVLVGDFTLNARVNGRDGAPWLVLSNSLATDLTMWDQQEEWLATRFRVMCYDTRGHGRSDVPPGPYSLPDLVGDVVALLDHFGVERASFMGLSLGGMTGLGLALHHPARVERLVCCDARADAPEPYVRGWAERMAAVEAGGMAAIVAGTLERWLSPRTRAERPECAHRLAAMIQVTPVAGYLACAAALQQLDYHRELPYLACPTLFVTGELDTAAPPEVMRDMAARVPGAQLAVVPGAAHIANLDAVGTFDAAVAEFLNAVP